MNAKTLNLKVLLKIKNVPLRTSKYLFLLVICCPFVIWGKFRLKKKENYCIGSEFFSVLMIMRIKKSPLLN